MEEPRVSTPVSQPAADETTTTEITLELAPVTSPVSIKDFTPPTAPPEETTTRIPLTLALEPTASTEAIKVATPASPTPRSSAAPAADVRIAAPQTVEPPKPVLAVAPPAGPANGSSPDLDNTQTLRVLSEAELGDAAGSKWFAVQLGSSEQPANLQMMPRLEIFAEYQLYTVVGAEGGKIQHLLRLGFFSDESAAQVVAGYMKSFFDAPTVAHVSGAEHGRFSRRQVKAKSAPAAANGASAGASEMSPSRNVPHSNGRDASAEKEGVSFVTEPRRRWTDAKPTARRPANGEASGEEARQTALSESAIRRLPPNSSLWKRLFKQS